MSPAEIVKNQLLANLALQQQDSVFVVSTESQLQKSIEEGIVENFFELAAVEKFDLDLEKAKSEGSISKDDLRKAQLDRSKLVQIMVTDKNGHRRKVWVKPGDQIAAIKRAKKQDTPGPHSRKAELMAAVDKLVAEKERKFGGKDISEPVSPEEKQLTAQIASIYSEINSIVKENRKSGGSTPAPVRKSTDPEEAGIGKHKELYGFAENDAVTIKVKGEDVVGSVSYWRVSPSVPAGYCVVELPDGTKFERSIKSLKRAEGNTEEGAMRITNQSVSENLQGTADTQSGPQTIFQTDVNKRFETMQKMVRAVGKGYQKSLIIYGSGGTGKTYTTIQELKKLGKVEFDEDEHMVGGDGYDFVKITGKVTPAALFRLLYEHNGKTLLFDDCDGFLKDDDAVNLLKGALDTSGDGTINWQSSAKIKDAEGEEMPKRFKFKGNAMFISNLPADKVPQPLKSRSLRVDMSMSKAQTIDRINHILEHIDFELPGTTMEDKREVLDYLKQNLAVTDDVNVRTLKSLLVLKKVNEGSEWKEDAKNFLLSKGVSETGLLIKANGDSLNLRQVQIEDAEGHIIQIWIE